METQPNNFATYAIVNMQWTRGRCDAIKNYDMLHENAIKMGNLVCAIGQNDKLKGSQCKGHGEWAAD